MKTNSTKGFTLLELLIVITIIAVLSVALIVVINPAETLKKARDTQRISDLASLKTAIGIYTTTVSPVYLAGASSNTGCKSTTWGASDLIYYSTDSGTAISDTTLDASAGASQPGPSQASAANYTTVAGSGWVPINFSAITGGSPISNLPIDPTNTVAAGTPIANKAAGAGTNTVVSGTTAAAAGAMNANALVYRYACDDANLTYEIDATLESAAYGVNGTDDKSFRDGGDSG